MLNFIFSFPNPIENEHSEIERILLDDSVDYFHLRKPSFDEIQMREFIQSIHADFHYKIVLHSHYHLLSEFELAGINLNSKSLSQIEYADEVNQCYIQPLVVRNRKIEVHRIQPEVVSYSAHSLEEINQLPFDVAYAFLSPIFDSISKPDYPSNFDLNELKSELSNQKTKIIALGGVKTEHFTRLKEVGFSGYARLGEVWLK
ncbi:MAG: thiamine phosphate synthase [Putridiphycobacter sp.]